MTQESSPVLACTLPGARLYSEAGPDLPDWCDPLDTPIWVNSVDATLVRDDDTVLGFEAAGRLWAIPWWVMKNHHVANLTLAGEPVVVTLCEACVAGGVFDPIVNGQRLQFRMLGWFRGSPMMADDLTGSWWALVNGHLLEGQVAGIERLPKRPITHATWKQWRTMYPDTMVAQDESEPRDGHGVEFLSPEHSLALPVGDVRLPPTELVIGVELGKRKRAYPLAEVHAAGGVVEDELDGRPIVIAARPSTWLAISFERELCGALVQLRWDEGGDGAPQFVDVRTGSRFNLWGLCLAGEYKGAALRYVPSSLKKWFGWALDTESATEVWPGGQAESAPSRPA